MEGTEPVNPERKVNLWLKIFLYPIASAYKITGAISSSYENTQGKLFATACILATEVLILNYGFPQVKGFAFSRWLFCILIVNGIPTAFFDKKATDIAQNYYAHYNKFLYYLFLLFLLAGFVLFGINMYESIGK